MCIDRTSAKCHTPRRNPSVDSALAFYAQLYGFTTTVCSFFLGTLLPMQTAAELTPKLLDVVFGDDLPFVAGDEVVLLVNSLGSTTMMELLIVLKEARAILDARGLKVHKTLVGPYVTCQEMAGISLSLLKLDDELKRFWDMPCASVCYSQM